MPYKVEIANTKSNTEFLQKLPKEILPEIAKRLNILGVKPYLGKKETITITDFGKTMINYS